MGAGSSTSELSDWVQSCNFSLDEIQDALFNETSLRLLLERSIVAHKSKKAKSVTSSDSVEYCLSAHQRHRLNASVAVTNSLIEGGIVDKGK